MNDDQTNKVVMTHQEETNIRIKSDSVDREKLKTTLSSIIDSLDPSSHPVGVVSIANGLVSSNNVNVDNSLEIGQQQMTEFQSDGQETSMDH